MFAYNPANTNKLTNSVDENITSMAEESRSSADADNRLDAFSGQSRSTNMVPFHMLYIVSFCAIVTLSLRRAVVVYGFLLVFFSNFVRKMHRF